MGDLAVAHLLISTRSPATLWQVALMVAANARIVDAGLLTIRARIGWVGLDAEIGVLAEIAESARAGSGAALRADCSRLLAAGIGVVAVNAGRRVALCKSGRRERQRAKHGSKTNNLLHLSHSILRC